MKILLIDDDRFFTEPLLWRLRQEEYHVTFCQSVDDVFDAEGNLRVSAPDCIILDIMMPRSNRYSKEETASGKDTGLRLLVDIQKKLPKVPVIVVTVRSDVGLSRLQQRFGRSMKTVLVKPVTPTQVLEAIRTLFPHTS